MSAMASVSRAVVNCRIGSLEIPYKFRHHQYNVNCRIGSLEIMARYEVGQDGVNCRIGSLEIDWLLVQMSGQC